MPLDLQHNIHYINLIAFPSLETHVALKILDKIVDLYFKISRHIDYTKVHFKPAEEFYIDTVRPFNIAKQIHAKWLSTVVL